MNNQRLEAAPPGDALDEVVAAQAGATPAASPNIETIIANELNPRPVERFDPAIHETDPKTGGPVYNSDNTLRRKRGRRPGQKYAPAAGNAGAGDESSIDDSSTPLGEGPAIVPMSPAQAKAEARLASAMTFSTLTSVLGDEWEPDPDERDSVEAALAEYIRTSGGLGLPPWAGVALAFGSYAMRRTRVGEYFGLRRADTAGKRLPPAGMNYDPEPAPEPEPEPEPQFRNPAPIPLNPIRGTSNCVKPPPAAREAA